MYKGKTIKVNIALITMLVALSCSVQAKIKTVKAMPLRLQQSYQYQQSYSGRVMSQHVTNIGFNLKPGWTGRINAIYVDTGDSFKKGDKLATVDAKVIEHQILQLKEKIKEAKLQLSQAKADRRRMKRFKLPQYRKNEQRKKFLTAQKVLESKIEQLKHQLNIEKSLLDKQTIIAPYNGVVTGRYLSIGSIVRSGEPILQLIDTEHYQINIGVPRHNLKELHLNERVTVYVGQQPYPGVIKSISPQENARTLTHNVLINITAKGIKIPNQALARINIPITVKKKGAWIPITAIEQNYQGLWSVYMLTKTANGHYKVVKRDTHIIFSDRNKVYVDLDRSKQGMIIKDGLFRVIPGEVVDIQQGQVHARP